MFNLRPIEFIKVECEHCTYRAQIAKMIHNVNAYITAVPMSNIQISKKTNKFSWIAIASLKYCCQLMLHFGLSAY